MIKQDIIGIYGASGLGRETLPLVRAQYPNSEYCFIDDHASKGSINNTPIYSYDDFLKFSLASKKMVIAIANSTIRETLVQKCLIDEIDLISIQAQNALIYDNVTIGEGAILAAFTHITSNVKIGKYFHANIYSYVAHDCVIGDFVTLAPRVSCNGNIIIEDHAYIGTGAVIKQGTPDNPLIIGKGTIIGMGAVVTKSVPPGVTVIGNPARILQK